MDPDRTTRQRSPIRAPGVQARVTFVLLGTALLLVATMLAAQMTQERQVGELFQDRALESGRAFERILEARAAPAAMHTDDYTRWDEFVQYVRTPDSTWAEINLTGGISTFGLDAAWVLDDQFALISTSNVDDLRVFDHLPVPIGTLSEGLRGRPAQHFFAVTPEGPLEVWTSSIVPSADLTHAARPHGYYVVGRLWTAERIEDLAKFADGPVRIVSASGFREGAGGSPESGRIEVRKALTGIDGRPVAGLEYVTRFVVAQRVSGALRSSSLLAMLGTILSLVAVWLAMSHWVGRPLAVITRSMRDENPDALADVRTRHDEIGEVAERVGEFFVQRAHLIEAREAAEAGAMAKSHFLANISHELRTTMHGILSFSRFGLRDSETASRKDLHDNFRQINECGESLLTLLNALLDLSRLEAGRMPFAYSDVMLAEVVDVAMDEFRPFYVERGIELRAEIEPELPSVVADRTRILQVLRNLISNAAKFTSAGGSVLVRFASGGNGQRVAVEDSGIGIPAGEEDVIFHKFTQASHTSARSGGTGLGLAICREIIQAHAGRVWAENRETGSARLVFEIPVAGPASQQVSTSLEAVARGIEPIEPIAASRPERNHNSRWRKAS